MYWTKFTPYCRLTIWNETWYWYSHTLLVHFDMSGTNQHIFTHHLLASVTLIYVCWFYPLFLPTYSDHFTYQFYICSISLRQTSCYQYVVDTILVTLAWTFFIIVAPLFSFPQFVKNHPIDISVAVVRSTSNRFMCMNAR